VEPENHFSLAAALENLYGRSAHRIELGLDLETELLERMGNPHMRMPHIHVAGTNGKGSVCAMIESVLRAAGYKTGLYTSPHLVRFNERIRVAGRCISDDELAALYIEIERRENHLSRPPTFFEFTTAMAFEYFKRQRVEVSVLETGLGGRLDATNVVMPLVSVITRIDIEHTQYLGKTMEEIAAEKSGIIKPACAVVCGFMSDAARGVVGRIARERGSRLILVEDAVSIRRTGQALRGQKIEIDTASGYSGSVLLPLLGKYQLENAALAVAVLEYLNDSSPFAVDENAMKKGLESVSWPGRCQILSEDPLIVLDVAHNPNGADALVESLKEIAKGRELGLVVGLLSDKDCRGVMKPFSTIVKKCWAVQILSERGMPLADLLACIRGAGISVEGRPLAEAFLEAKAWAKANNAAVCIAGSLYLAGDVLQAEGLGENLFE
jgi:dihydrofolate synthase / folylpolyglutamate synthase